MHRAARARFLPVIALLVVGLTACVPDEPSEPIETPIATETPSPTPEVTPTEEPEEPVYPELSIDCNVLLPPGTIYDYNANVNLLGEFTPSTTSLSAGAVERNGTACRWVNASSGESIDAAVATIPEPELTALKNDAVGSSNSVPTYGVEGYFEVDGGIGRAQAFSGSNWIILESTAFFEPGDAATLMAAAIAALG
jgi:hypothetical protein